MADRLHLIADFNAETLARLLAHTALPGAEVTVAPFNQVRQALAGSGPGPGASAVVWTQPAAVVDAFRRALEFESVDIDEAVAETRAFAGAIAAFARGCRYAFVPTWTLPVWYRGYGALDFRPGVGMAHLLARMNVALAETLAPEPNVFVLEAARWLAAAGARATPRKNWYATKTPFAASVFEQAAADIAAALAAAAGLSRRVVILDLDQVLWGGIVGELGWEGVTLGGHDHVGEAFVDFQRALRALTRRGIQLAIASKNDERVALEAIDRHPEMQLRRADFAAWRINWSDKAQNVVELLREINLGPESAVFIDDSAIERARVKDAVPGVLAPEWPDDPAQYVEALAALRVFDAATVTSEDRARSGMYAAERARKETAAAAGDLETWLASLDIRLTVDAVGPSNAERATQLLNKTNQMNLRTRRLSQPELQAWAAVPGHALLAFRVADRFGDSGLTGVVGLAVDDGRAELTDFLLSCRVMGRNVEEAMLHAAAAHARARGASALVAAFAPTARNAPCLEFLRRSGLREEPDGRFTWNLAQPYPCPRWVAVDDRTGVTAAAH